MKAHPCPYKPSQIRLFSTAAVPHCENLDARRANSIVQMIANAAEMNSTNAFTPDACGIGTDAWLMSNNFQGAAKIFPKCFRGPWSIF
jgi:hypothetical protein